MPRSLHGNDRWCRAEHPAADGSNVVEVAVKEAATAKQDTFGNDVAGAEINRVAHARPVGAPLFIRNEVKEGRPLKSAIVEALPNEDALGNCERLTLEISLGVKHSQAPSFVRS
jgi:hypothetical protein